MSDYLTGNSKKIWLAMLKEGGRHTAAEAAKAIGLRSDDARALLNSMAKAGGCRKFEKAEGQSVVFGVTASCTVPRGVTLGDIMSCNVMSEESPGK